MELAGKSFVKGCVFIRVGSKEASGEVKTSPSAPLSPSDLALGPDLLLMTVTQRHMPITAYSLAGLVIQVG